MTYRYDEPIRAEDGVLFRVHDHALRSFLFKVDKPVLEALYVADIGPKNPIDPADRAILRSTCSATSTTTGHSTASTPTTITAN